MRGRWMLLDCNFLAYRAFYSMGDLSHRGVKTGLLYGFLRDMLDLQDRFRTGNMIFCFDWGKSLRCLSHREYKAHRSDLSPEEVKLKREVQRQTKLLRTEYLPAVGFRNIAAQEGYEADDLIAQVAQQLDPRTEEGIVVSADHDLYQLLAPHVSVYSPNKQKLITPETFTEEYGISPSQWVDVKSIAGCTSDNIPGVVGVGEKTAIKFLTGKLKPESKKYAAIVNNNRTWRKNQHLVQLPYPGTEPIRLRKDRVSEERWRAFCKEHGLRSLRSQTPRWNRG